MPRTGAYFIGPSRRDVEPQALAVAGLPTQLHGSQPFEHLCSFSMAPTLVHLPNGQTLTVSPVFAGLAFKSNELTTHHSVFPPGWTIIIESEDELEPEAESEGGEPAWAQEEPCTSLSVSHPAQ